MCLSSKSSSVSLQRNHIHAHFIKEIKLEAPYQNTLPSYLIRILSPAHTLFEDTPPHLICILSTPPPYRNTFHPTPYQNTLPHTLIEYTPHTLSQYFPSHTLSYIPLTQLLIRILSPITYNSINSPTLYQNTLAHTLSVLAWYYLLSFVYSILSETFEKFIAIINLLVATELDVCNLW